MQQPSGAATAAVKAALPLSGAMLSYLIRSTAQMFLSTFVVLLQNMLFTCEGKQEGSNRS